MRLLSVRRRRFTYRTEIRRWRELKKNWNFRKERRINFHWKSNISEFKRFFTFLSLYCRHQRTVPLEPIACQWLFHGKVRPKFNRAMCWLLKLTTRCSCQPISIQMPTRMTSSKCCRLSNSNSAAKYLYDIDSLNDASFKTIYCEIYVLSEYIWICVK